MRRVLLIEDSPTYAAYIIDKLDGVAEVVVVDNAADAVRLQSQQKWDAVISDMVLPGALNSSLAKVLQLRAKCPLFFVTGKKIVSPDEAINVMAKSDATIEFIKETISNSPEKVHG